MSQTTEERDAGSKANGVPVGQLHWLGHAWKLRGGTRGFVRSKYTWGSAIFTVVAAHLWLVEQWWELPLSILPNVVGFSLGGYAILLAFGDDKFRTVLLGRASKRDEDDATMYLKVSSTFLIFIMAQIGALFCAILARSLYFDPAVVLGLDVHGTAWLQHSLAIARYLGAAFGFFVFIYALSLAGAAAMSVFSLSRWFERVAGGKPTSRPTAPTAPTDPAQTREGDGHP